MIIQEENSKVSENQLSIGSENNVYIYVSMHISVCVCVQREGTSTNVKNCWQLENQNDNSLYYFCIFPYKFAIILK